MRQRPHGHQRVLQLRDYRFGRPRRLGLHVGQFRCHARHGGSADAQPSQRRPTWAAGVR